MARCMVLRLVKSASRVGMALLLLSLLLQPGCKRSAAIVDSKDKAASPKMGDSDEFLYKRPNGDVVHTAGGKPIALPSEFPADVAVYPQAKIIMAVIGEKESSLTLTTADSPEKVLAFYRGYFKQNGWKTTTDRRQLSMLEGEKDGRKLGVLVSTKPDETSVQVTVTKPAK